uniref:Uncharacterized protein n=1 Tax=Anopheles minimus TaxID=112268 RepID=A0A182WPR9_9DIPT
MLQLHSFCTDSRRQTLMFLSLRQLALEIKTNERVLSFTNRTEADEMPTGFGWGFPPNPHQNRGGFQRASKNEKTPVQGTFLTFPRSLRELRNDNRFKNCTVEGLKFVRPWKGLLVLFIRAEESLFPPQHASCPNSNGLLRGKTFYAFLGADGRELPNFCFNTEIYLAVPKVLPFAVEIYAALSTLERVRLVL